MTCQYWTKTQFRIIFEHSKTRVMSETMVDIRVLFFRDSTFFSVKKKVSWSESEKTVYVTSDCSERTGFSQIFDESDSPLSNKGILHNIWNWWLITNMQGKIHRFSVWMQYFWNKIPLGTAQNLKNPGASLLDPANAVVSPGGNVWRRPSNLNAKHAEWNKVLRLMSTIGLRLGPEYCTAWEILKLGLPAAVFWGRCIAATLRHSELFAWESIGCSFHKSSSIANPKYQLMLAIAEYLARPEICAMSIFTILDIRFILSSDEQVWFKGTLFSKISKNLKKSKFIWWVEWTIPRRSLVPVPPGSTSEWSDQRDVTDNSSWWAAVIGAATSCPDGTVAIVEKLTSRLHCQKARSETSKTRSVRSTVQNWS